MGKHPYGLKHIGIVRTPQGLRAIKQLINLQMQLLDRLIKPLLFQGNAFGNEIVNRNPWLVQNHMAKRNAVSQRFTAQMMAAHVGNVSCHFTRHFPPEAITSASTMAVVCSASSSSSE
jgi:hypothetical protein